MPRWTCRRARLREADAIEALQVRCASVLGRGFYTAEEIDAYIREVGTLDKALIADGTYFVAVDDETLVGCGGWSLRSPHYVDFANGDDVAQSVPLLRGFFVDPGFARRGVGRAIVAHVERDIRRAGYPCVALTAMLSGVAFYRSLSYRKTGNSSMALANGVHLPSIEMIKHFDHGVTPQESPSPKANRTEGNDHV